MKLNEIKPIDWQKSARATIVSKGHKKINYGQTGQIHYNEDGCYFQPDGDLKEYYFVEKDEFKKHES